MPQITGKNKGGFLATIAEFVILLFIVFLIRTFGFGLYQVPTGSMETTMLVGERFFASKLTYWCSKPKHGDIIAFNDPLYDYSDNSFVNLFQNYVWGPANWTKRVIGLPGDHVQGKIEDGKPEIYLNGKKLDEHYLNKYPLIRVWRDDPNILRASVETELQARLKGGMVDTHLLTRILDDKLSGQVVDKSYNPAVSYEQQVFYQIKPERIVKGLDGKPELAMPGTPRYSKVPVGERGNRFWDGSDEFNVKLGNGEYWGMGDNRQGSKDCRVFGPIKGSAIHAKIIFLIWSVDSDESWWIFDLIKHPVDFFKRVRWNRFFQWMN